MEQRLLAVIGVVALAGLGVLCWQQRRSAWRIAAGVSAPAPAETASWDRAVRAARQVDLNEASIAELERLPQVGPSLARRIVAHREAHGPFGDSEELMDVPGIGPKTYDALKDYIAVE